MQEVFVAEFLIARNLRIVDTELSEGINRFFAGVLDSKSQTHIILAPWFVDNQAAQLLRARLRKEKAQISWLARILRKNPPAKMSEAQLADLAGSVSKPFRIDSKAEMIRCTRVLTEQIHHALQSGGKFVFFLWDESSMPCICKVRTVRSQDRVNLLGQFIASEHRQDTARAWAEQVLLVWKANNLIANSCPNLNNSSE